MSADRAKKKQRPASSPELAMYKYQDDKSHGPDLALFAGSTGLTAKQRQYIERHGGTFAFDLPRGQA